MLRLQIACRRRPIDTALGAIDISVSGSLIFDTETGEISRSSSGVLRSAGVGLDANSGIHFAVASQGGAPDIGVFTAANVVVRAGEVLRAQGDNVFAIVSADDVIVAEVIDVDGGADTCSEGAGACPGPGGERGGNAGTGNPFVGNPSGDGGNGAWLTVLPETGGDSAFQAGGGGGGDGRIRLHRAKGSNSYTSGTLSPLPSQGPVLTS